MNRNRQVSISLRGGLCFWLIAAVVLAVTGCTTVYENEDTGDTWRVPAGFDRIAEAEDDRIVFAVRDRRRDQVATVEAIAPPVAPSLLPAYLTARLDTDGAQKSAKPSLRDDPAGWSIAGVDDGDEWSRIWAGSGAERTYLLTLRGSGDDESADDRFAELVDGLSPSDRPQMDDELPEHRLADGLGEPKHTELNPVDADGSPRTADMRSFSADRLVTTGVVLREPLTYEISAEDYAAAVLDRLDGERGAEVDAPGCGDGCRALYWSDGRPHTSRVLVVVVDGERAYQLRLRFPEPAGEALEGHRRDWISEFADAPSSPFENRDTETK